jgi:hypothetical protein
MKSLLALPGIALAKVMPTPSAEAAKPIKRKSLTVECIMAEMGPAGRLNNGIRFGSWLVYWTGWKSEMTNMRMIGQWVASPINKLGMLDESRYYLYVSTPGGWGTFRRGDTFNVALRWPQRSAEDYLSAGQSREEVERAMEPERRIALQALLGLCGQADWLIETDLRDPWLNSKVYDKLSPHIQFYLDADCYIRSHDLENNCETLLKLQRQLLG